jgi:hypothetical protein
MGGGVYKGDAKEMSKLRLLECIGLFLVCCFVTPAHGVEVTAREQLCRTDRETTKVDRKTHSGTEIGTWNKVSQKITGLHALDSTNSMVADKTRTNDDNGLSDLLRHVWFEDELNDKTRRFWEGVV